MEAYKCNKEIFGMVARNVAVFFNIVNITMWVSLQEGIEKTLATNYLGSFLLTALILDKLLAQQNPVRLVFLNTNIIERKYVCTAFNW